MQTLHIFNFQEKIQLFFFAVGIHNIECEMDLEKSLNGSQDEEEDSGYHTYSSERRRHDRYVKMFLLLFFY